MVLFKSKHTQNTRKPGIRIFGSAKYVNGPVLLGLVMAKSLYRSENLELAYLLRQLREESGMIQSKLGDRLGRNQTYVSNVELAIRRLDLVELRDYCAGLDIGLLDLISKWETRLQPKARSANRKSKHTT